MTPSQCKAARALLDWSQHDLSGAAGVTIPTVISFERGSRRAHPKTSERLRRAIEAAGIELIDENGGGLGVRFKNRQQI